MLTSLSQYLKEHRSAILATIVILQNLTPAGKGLHEVLQGIGFLLSN